MVRGIGCLKVMGAGGAVDEDGGEGGAGVARDEDSGASGTAASSSTLGFTPSEIIGPTTTSDGPGGPDFTASATGISRFCHGSVDTPIDGVDTGSESLKLFHENRGVDTVPGSVNTRPSFQKTLFGQLGQCVDTLSGSVDTLRLKFQLMIFSGHVATWGSREST
ncbi:hypothetical protein Taro_053391 [Colocasia esculenta]|uniref:Uncharacterized protein n=1 Tax=Colocasia esculenta TaxID=4460 RepID=A0A843XMG2_COLES|nr:hypothetical protein [Colocasia esculenta]